jgi:hypothetical protein
VGYSQRDTTIDCDTYERWSGCRSCEVMDANGTPIFVGPPIRGGTLANAATGTGVGGSMARFTIVNDFLYGVSMSKLYAISLYNPAQPVVTNEKDLGWGIETIFPFKDKLMIGSNTGMFIFSLDYPSNPFQLGQFSHARSCDPVIADGSYAFVTLRSGNTCVGNDNQMDVLDISNPVSPQLVKTYPMDNPRGLSKDGNTMLVCDGNALKVYDASNVNALQLLQTISNTEAFDVIAIDKLAIVVGKDGLYQYDYSNPSAVTLRSKMLLVK